MATLFFYVLEDALRILYVDDDPILREFAQVHLTTDSATISTAEDGVAALEAMAGDVPTSSCSTWRCRARTACGAGRDAHRGAPAAHAGDRRDRSRGRGGHRPRLPGGHLLRGQADQLAAAQPPDPLHPPDARGRPRVAHDLRRAVDLPNEIYAARARCFSPRP